MNAIPMDDPASTEARRWYARLHSPDCTSDERATFQQWQVAHPDHAAAYARVEGLMGRVDELRDDWAFRLAARDALRTDPHRPPWKRIAAVALAASLVLAVGAGVLLYRQPEVAAVHYATRVGEQRNVVLEDGTTLLLDTGTRVDVRYSGHARRVTLMVGRAQYDVAHDANRPFLVEALGGTVTALGTRFQTDLRDGRVVVALLEGSVAVERDAGADRQRLTLAPGEQLTYDAGGTLWAKAPARLEAATGWTQGKLVFKDAPLAELVAEVNRYASVKLRIADPALEKLRISGTFQADDQESLLLALRGIWSIRTTRQPDGEILLRR